MKKVLKMTLFVVTLYAVNGAVFASGDHQHGHDDDHQHNHNDEHSSHGTMDSSASGGMFLKKKNIDGYDVTFHVMKAKPGKEMGGSHDFMIKVEKDGKTEKNIVMNTKVVYPDGKAESKPTMLMGDWLMAGYDLGQKGKHQLMILFKTADGQKHKGGVYYSGE